MINEQGSQTFCTATVLKGLQCGMNSSPDPSSSRFTYSYVHWTIACTEMQQPAARAKDQTLPAFSCSLSNQLYQEHYQDMGLEKQSPDRVCGWARLCGTQKRDFRSCAKDLSRWCSLDQALLSHTLSCVTCITRAKLSPGRQGMNLTPVPEHAGRARTRFMAPYVHSSYPAIRLKEQFDKSLVCPELLFQPYQTS